MRRRSTVLGGLAGLLAAGALAAVPSAVPSAGAADDPWAGVSWTAPSAVSPAGVDVDRGGVWQLGDGSQLALWSVYDDPSVPGDGPAQVWTSTRPTSAGDWSSPVAVSDYQQYFTTYPNFTWTADPSGAAVLAWTQYDPGTTSWTFRATVRSPAGAWSAPATVATEDTGAVGSIGLANAKAAAVAPDGRATVAFVADEAAPSPGEGSADEEVFRTAWSGSAWSAPEEVSVETPSVPIGCAEPDPADCPDLEGDSRQPMVAYDGLGQEWVAWVHNEAADEPAEEAGVFLRGTGTTQLAAGSEAQARTFGLAGIDGDAAGGVALAWRRQVVGVTGGETWAHAGGDVSGATSLVLSAAGNGSVRSVAMDDGRAVVVIGLSGSNQLATALRSPGAGMWGPATDVLEDGGGVAGTSGRAVLTPGGVPVVAYVSSSDRARALAPAGTQWRDTSISGTLDVSGTGSVVQSFTLTPAGTLLASWLSADGGVDRLHVAASTGLPSGTPPAPPPTPTPTAPGAASVTTAASHTVRWGDSAGATSYDVRHRRAPWNGGFGAFTYPSTWQGRTATSVAHTLTRGSTTCYSVRARNAGGTSAWSSERCMVAPLDQVSLTRSTGWTVQKSGAYYGGSAWTASRKGRSLARTGAALRRVGIVATTCPTCGIVDVFVGSSRIGRLSLARGTTTRNRQVLLLPAFSSRRGTVRVVVVSNARTVRIDGLVVSAR